MSFKIGDRVRVADHVSIGAPLTVIGTYLDRVWCTTEDGLHYTFNENRLVLVPEWQAGDEFYWEDCDDYVRTIETITDDYVLYSYNVSGRPRTFSALSVVDWETCKKVRVEK